MSQLQGTGALVRLMLRRDRIRLSLWIGGILVIVAASAQAVRGVYVTQADFDVYARTVGGSAVSVATNGPAVALDTIGGITVFEINSTALLATALMAVFLVIRHTRGEEETGRAELVRAAAVGRHAPLVAALSVVTAASVVVGAGIGLALVGLGLPVGGSLVYGASIAAAGLVFTAVGLCAAQVSAHARTCLGIALAALGASFVLRAVGDVGNGVLSWLSPLGWSQAVHAFGGNRWWPLLLSLAATVALLRLATWLAALRDLDTGLVAPRPGPAHAGERLGSAFGLAFRLQRMTMLAWAVGLLLFGLVFGSLSGDIREIVESNETAADALLASGAADIADAFFGTVLLFLALASAGFTVSSVLRLRTEEAAGRAEPLLATGLSRWRWTAGSLAVTVLGSVAVVTAGGLGLGVAYAGTSGDPEQVLRMVGLSLTYVPAALVLGGIGVLLFGVLPSLSVAVWGLFAVYVVVGWLGGLLDLPAWVQDLSPFTHVPRVPVDAVAYAPLVALCLLAAGLAVGGLAAFRRRDLA